MCEGPADDKGCARLDFYEVKRDARRISIEKLRHELDLLPMGLVIVLE